jgi:hypothetical protein
MKKSTMFIVIVFCIITSAYAQESFIKRSVDLNFQGACSIGAADINNDGHEDVLGIASASNQVAWWENDGAIPPHFTKHLIDNDFYGAIYVSSNDLNGDSLADVLGAAWYGGKICIWINNGGSPVSWTKQAIDTEFTQAHEVKAADIDGTGGLDIVAASAGKDEIAWWQNNGGNPIAWTKYTVTNTATGARSVVPVDIDDDSDIDLVCAAFASNDVILFRNQGGNPVQWIQEVIDNNFYGAHWVDACDLDLDGDQDILGAGYNAGDIVIWYNEGGVPVQWFRYTLESSLPGALSVIADDLDNDSLPDVIAAGDNAGDIITWYNQGVSAPSFLKVALESSFPGVWPVNTFNPENDHDRDILSASSTLSDIFWWDNQHTITSLVQDHSQVNPDLELTVHPNPFSSEVKIQLSLPEQSQIKVMIIASDGKPIRLLYWGKAGKGRHSFTWDGKNSAGTVAEKGFYVCVIETEKGDILSCRFIKEK